MKLLYLINIDDSKKDYIGIFNKINGQLEAFKKNNVDVDLYNFKETCDKYLLSKLLKRIWFFSANNSKYTDNLDYGNYDTVYIRHSPIDLYFLRLLKNIKSCKKSLKIILEIPTYPYDKEYNSFRTYHLLLKDMFFRRYLRKYLYKIVTFSSDKVIYGIPTVNVNNGIDLNKINIKQFSDFDGELNVLCVANVSFWHGYDRFIQGMFNYYNSNNCKVKVNLHIVGSGTELSNLKQKVEKFQLSDYVNFYGAKTGKELDEIFNKCHIAIDHLGLHRKGLSELSSLKSKEYCARGIPFVMAHFDKAFNDYNYIYMTSPNELPVNISDIINFAKKVVKKDTTEEMRKYSQSFSWDNIIKNILDQI